MTARLCLAALALGWSAGAAVASPEANSLSAAERKAGWRLLFDGKTTTGWRGFNRPGMPDGGWVVRDGTLGRVRGPGDKNAPGDIITIDEFENFELSVDYRITSGGNSGIKYLVDERMVKQGHSGLGFEYQVLDDQNADDASKGKDGNHAAGALYDLIAPATDKRINPAGQWNSIRLIVSGPHIEHWLNGRKVVEYNRPSPELKALIAGSKYKDIPGFGQAARGHLLLQDHPGEVAFRNIKLRSLSPRTP